MTTHTLFARCAGSAIAASLALSPTMLLAQDAQVQDPATAQPPVITPVLPPAPVTVAPPATAPAQIAPQPQMQTKPVVQAVPAEPETPEPVATESQAPVASTVAPTQRSAPATTTRTPAARPAPQTEAPAANEPLTTDEPSITEMPAVSSAPQPVVANPVPEPRVEATGDGIDTTDVAVGGLAAVVLGMMGFVALRRRRDVPPSAPRAGAVTANPRPQAAPARTTEFVDARPIAPVTADRGEVFAPQYAGQHSPIAMRATPSPMASAGASVPLPRSKPATREERVALIDRLAAARPDRANPFHAHKARRRRARMIVQSLGREFPNGSFIDFSQYPANWPNLARETRGAVA